MITKESYLKALRDNLKNVPPQEVDNIMQYYTEYFEEAGEENTQQVIDELGSAWQLAQKVSAGYVIQNIESGTGNKTIKQKASNTWALVTAIVTAPVWIPLIIVVAVVMLALFVSIIGIIVSFFAVAVCAVAAAVILFFTGLFMAFESVGAGLVLIGMALEFIAVTILMVLMATGVVKLAELLVVFIAKKVVKKK